MSILDTIKQDIENSTQVADIAVNSRKRRIVLARFMYFGLAYHFSKMSLEMIGAKVGRDHSTVIYGLDHMDNYLIYEPDLLEIYQDLREAYTERYGRRIRVAQDIKVKNQDRQRKRVLRKINALTAQDLNKIEDTLNELIA